MRVQLSLFVLWVAMLGWQPTSLALGRRVIDCEAARRGFTVNIMRGIGVDLRLSCGGNIADVQLSDPSRVVVRKRGPQHLFIKAIVPVHFDGNLSSSNGTAMLSVIMTSGEVYQFLLHPSGGEGYSLLDIGGKKENLPSRSFAKKLDSPPLMRPQKIVKGNESPPASDSVPFVSGAIPLPEFQPDSPSPLKKNSPSSPDPDLTIVKPPLPVIPDKAIHSHSASTYQPLNHHRQANALVNALVIAQRSKDKKVKVSWGTYDRVQDVIWRLRKGNEITVAAKASGVSLDTIKLLLSLVNFKLE
jgi:hypothetical protein